MAPPILTATGIRKSFRHFLIKPASLQDRLLRRGRHRKSWNQTVLDGVDLAVRPGECIGLQGPNGCGKTTLLKILAGLLPHDAGDVWVDGTLSCFFELGVGFHPERTAEENIYLHGLLQGMTPKEIRRRTAEIIRFAGVESHAHVPLKSYSMGMRQRIGFAASVHVRSDIYLVDEVIAVGDKAFQELCYGHLRSLKERGAALVLVSHSVQDALFLCDRVLNMREGRVAEGLTVPARSAGLAGAVGARGPAAWR